MDNIQKIVKFNEMAGNECVRRNIGDCLPQLYMSLISEEHLEELIPAYNSGNVTEVLDGAADLIVVASGLIHALGFDVNEVLGIVCDSNLSKFDISQEAAERSVAAYASDPRYVEVHYAAVGGMYVIRGKKVGEEENGWKILKSTEFREPDFSDIIGSRQ